MKLPNKNSIFPAVLFIMLSSLAAHGEGPERIVSLAPSITESIYQLGAEERLLAVTSFCNWPPEAKTKEVIGTLTNPNIEKIYSLGPDIILATDGINRSQTIEKLRSLGLRVVIFEGYNNIGDVSKNFVKLGKLLGKEKIALEISGQVEREIKKLGEAIKGRPRPRVFWEVGSRPLVAAGEGSFANEFIRHSGGINIFSETGAEYLRISREEVLRRNPEVIILVTMGNVTKKEKLYWQKFKSLKAVQTNRIYVIDADKVCRPAPLSFLEGLRETVRLMHGDELG